MKLFARILFASFLAVACSNIGLAQTSISTFLDRDGKSITARLDAPKGAINRPRIVELQFIGFWKSGKPTNLQTEIVWGENKRITARANFSVKRCYREDKIECYELVFTLPVAYETIESLLKSEKVAITFNDTSLKLTAEEINRLQDFVKSVEER